MAKGSLKSRFRRAVTITLALLLLALGGGFLAVRTSLPTLDGTIAVAGLGAPVEVLREANGVPHIYAASVADAYFGLGFVHAQDRLWQLEARRRLGAGRLSEFLGPTSLDIDRFFRTLGLFRAAERGFAALDAEARAAYVAYAGGINAYLETRRGLLPLEFLIVRAPAPTPWRPADSLVVLKLMAWDLGGSWRDELLRLRLSRRLTPEQIDELWPPYPADGPVALPPTRLTGLDELWDRTPPGPAPGAGSNNWVVAGDRSETGWPLLANDPHLRLAAPGPFYLAHLSAPGLEVVGATLPGTPGVILGRNDRIAWGFTNTRPDTQDLFIERVDPSDPARYLVPGSTRAFAARREVIEVHGEDDVVIVVRETRHGPVLTDLQVRDSEAVDGAEVLALAWTALRDDDRTPQAAIAMGGARDWAGFVAALRDFHGPQQNIVYADIDGNIEFTAPARVPVRRSGDGWFPVPGWSGEFDWDGFVPYDALPRAFNPPSGLVVTANNKIVADGYPHFLTRDWRPPYRARRIATLLEGRRHTQEGFRAIQADVVSLMAREMAPYLLAATPATATGRAAQALIRGWDGAMARDRPEPLIFSAWYRSLTRLIYADELGPLFDAAWGLRPLFVQGVLEGRYAGWCDDVTTESVEGCAELTSAALDRAMAALAETYGADPARWRWGTAHTAEHGHAVFQRVRPFKAWFGIRIANGGGPFTVDAASYDIGDPLRPFAQNHGPAFRAVYDLAEFDRSLFVTATGQSGNPLSPHYRDFVERWRDHRPFTIPTTRGAVDAARTARLILAPR